MEEEQQRAKRFEVVIERRIIVYAEDTLEAHAKGMAYINSGFQESQPAARPAIIKSIDELPSVDPRGDIIDVSPKQAAAQREADERAKAAEAQEPPVESRSEYLSKRANGAGE